MEVEIGSWVEVEEEEEKVGGSGGEGSERGWKCMRRKNRKVEMEEE